MSLKPLVWIGTSRRDYASFPEDVQSIAGRELWLVQSGREPMSWKPMPVIGAGVNEIRVYTKLAHRVFYVAKFPEGIYVLHAFEKKTQQTSQVDIDKGKTRFAEMKRGRP